jgi:hypothetical protein
MSNTMSEKLNRIKNLTNALRTTANMSQGSIDEVVSTIDQNIQGINNTISEKNTEIETLQEGKDIFRAKTVELIKDTVVNPKDGDMAVVVSPSTSFPKYQEAVSQATVYSMVDLGDKTFGEWLDEFYTTSGYSPSTMSVGMQLRSSDYDTSIPSGQYITIQVRNDSSMFRITMTYRDYVTNDQLTCYYYIYPEEFESTTLTARTATFRDGATSAMTNFLSAGSYTLNFPQDLTLVSTRDYSLLSNFISFNGVAYDGVHVYNKDGEEWERMPVGLNLNPDDVLTGVQFKTDEGEKTGTLGDDILTQENIERLGKVFKNTTDGKINIGTLGANSVFKAIQKGTTVLTPLFHTVDWSSIANYSSFLSGITLDEFDLTKMKDGILGQPTNLSSFLANNHIGNLNLSPLDVSRVTSISYSSAPWEQMSSWLCEEKTFNSLSSTSGTSTGIFGSYGEEHHLLTIKNRTYPSLRGIYGTFGNLTCPNILLENLHFGAEIDSTSYLFNKTVIQSLCIKNCTGLKFKYFSSSTDKSNAYRYTFTDGYTQGTLKYLIFDIDYVLNFPAYFSYTPTSIRLDPRLRECDLYTSGYIYVRDNMVTSYKNSSYWSSFSSRIKPISEMTQELKDIYGYNEEV